MVSSCHKSGTFFPSKASEAPFQRYKIYAFDDVTSLGKLIKNVFKIVANIFIQFANYSDRALGYIKGRKPITTSIPYSTLETKASASPSQSEHQRKELALLEEKGPVVSDPEPIEAEDVSASSASEEREEFYEVELDVAQINPQEDVEDPLSILEEELEEYEDAADRLTAEIEDQGIAHKEILETILQAPLETNLLEIFSEEELQELRKQHFLIDFYQELEDRGITTVDEATEFFEKFSQRELKELSVQELEAKLREYPREKLLEFKELLSKGEDLAHVMQDPVKKKVF